MCNIDQVMISTKLLKMQEMCTVLCEGLKDNPMHAEFSILMNGITLFCL